MGAAWNRRNPEKMREASRRWAQKNREKSRACSRAWKRANPEKVAAYVATYERPTISREQALGYTHKYRAKHPEQYRAAVRRWALLNPHRRRASKAIRRALERMALPIWADKQRIAEIYEEATARQRETGIAHHVDHIVPLNHPLVCGLHCEENLRVIEGAENLRKGNRFHVAGRE